MTFLLSLPSSQCFSDPTHILRNYLAEQDLIDIRISGVETPTEGKFYKVYSNYRNYSHGYAQPGENHYGSRITFSTLE